MTLEQLRAAWNDATERDDPRRAARARVELEPLEPDEPRSSQRLGDAYRRLPRERGR